MVEELIKLRNTMMQIETKGDSTKLMTNCLYFIEDMINKENEKKVEPNTSKKE